MILRFDDRNWHPTLRTLRWTLAIALLTLVIIWKTCPVFAGISADQMRKGLEHTGNVNDFAKVLSSVERADLESRCLNLRKKTGASLVIVTIESLQGGDIDDFANKLFNQWGIGQKGKDDGLLLLVAVRDHKFRIEVGYGLEPIIPDALGLRILNEELPDRFRQARYADGLRAAIVRLTQLVERRQPAALTHVVQPHAKRDLVMVLCSVFLIGLGLGSKVTSLCLFSFIVCLMYLTSCISSVPPLLLIPMAIVPVWLGCAVGRLGVVIDHLRGQHVEDVTWSEMDWVWSRPREVEDRSYWTRGGYGRSSGGFGGGSFGGGSSGGGGGSGGW